MAKGDKHAFVLLLYPDSQSYDCQGILQNCIDYFDKVAYILHDKDLSEDGSGLKKAHYHVCGYLDNATTVSAVASHIDLPDNYIRVSSAWRKAVQYLVHANDPDKYQYPIADVWANFDTGKIFKQYDAVNSFIIIGNFMFDNSVVNPFDLFTLIKGNPRLYAEFRRAYPIFRDMLKYNNGGRL